MRQKVGPVDHNRGKALEQALISGCPCCLGHLKAICPSAVSSRTNKVLGKDFTFP